MTEAWTAQVIAGTKLVLLSLCDNANDEGECWPSVGTIAERCSMGIRTVQAHLVALEGAGMISRGIRAGHANVYQIHPIKFHLTPADSAPHRAQISHPRKISTTAESAPHPREICTPAPAESAPPNGHTNIRIESSVESSKDKRKDRSPARRRSQYPPIPFEAIVAAYHELLPMCPRVHVFGKQRQAKLHARWMESAERQELAWWRQYFAWVAESRFLTGQVPSRDGRAPFLADFEWLLGETNMAKAVEGKYHREAA